MEIEDILKDPEALAELAREFGLALVLLYGSRARGLTHAESDTDIGVVRMSGAGFSYHESSDLQYRLSQFLGLGEVDLVDLLRVSGLLRHAAAERGIVLYEASPGVFTRFRVLAWNLYQDERLAIRRHDSQAIQVALESLRR